MFTVWNAGRPQLNKLTWSSIVCCALAAGALAACGSSGSEQVGVLTQDLGTQEARRVQDFLNARYRMEDVEHSFHTVFGETVDCIDFFAQAGVKQLAAAGTPITEIPKPPSDLTVSQTAASEFEFNGSLDENGNRRECAGNTVPILRITAANIATSGGLDAFLRSQTRQHHHGAPRPPAAPPASAPPPPQAVSCTTELGVDYAHLQHVQEIFQSSATQGPFNITLAVADFSLPQASIFPSIPAEQLATPADEPHNITQIWVFSGYGANDFGCVCGGSNPPCAQTVEAGAMIDSGAAIAWPHDGGTQLPHLAIFSTNNGYGNNSNCYAHLGCASPAPVWFGVTGARMTPGMTLPASSLGAAPLELALQASNATMANTHGWWIAGGINAQTSQPVISTGYLGVFTAGSFSGGMQNAAQTFMVGGEVYDFTDTFALPMGTGAALTAGFGQTAYVRNASTSPVVAPIGIQSTRASTAIPRSYAWTNSPAPAPPASTWQNGFYYGDLPKLLWGGTNFGLHGTAWSGSNYAAECGDNAPTNQGQALIGLSAAASSLHQAHSIQCEVNTVSSTQSACYARSFDPTNNQPSGAVDWDAGYAKAQCAAGEYVQGVEQSTSGVINGILCCPSSTVTQTSCAKQIFYGANSPNYTTNGGADWDNGYDKGQCLPNQVVTGVSAVVSASNGVVGAPHAIYCCPGG
jgi:hypothetical protein